MHIPFSPPDIKQSEIDAVVAVLKSGWLGPGQISEEFQALLKQYCSVDYALLLNSATAGLELALRYYGIQVGDEVITTPYTYAATLNVIERVGAKIVLVDIQDNDFHINTNLIAQSITSKTKAVISVDFAGLPVHYNEIKNIIHSKQFLFQPSSLEQEQLNRILFISDAAHSLGSEYNHLKVGSQADISVFSFHVVKNLTTVEGGAIVFNENKQLNSSKLEEFITLWSLNGKTKNSYYRNNQSYDIQAPGYSFPMPDILASIGVSQLKRYEKMLERKWLIADTYNKIFQECSECQAPLLEDQERKSNAHLYPLRLENKERKKQVQTSLNEAGIATNSHFIPTPMLSYYKQYFDIKDFPVSLHSYEREISLPIFSSMSDLQLNYIKDSLLKILWS